VGCIIVTQLCNNAAPLESFALLLTANVSLIQSVLELLATARGETRHAAAGFLAKTLAHNNRHMTQRLAFEYRALPAIIGALRDACSRDDETLMRLCLACLLHLLRVGDVEAEDDRRGINPYIEPVDTLGEFESVDPIRSGSDEHLAKMAEWVFAYFIPNDTE
jgi:hypothetical protein